MAERKNLTETIAGAGWRTVMGPQFGTIGDTVTAGNYVAIEGVGTVLVTANTANLAAMYIDPAWYALGSLAPRFRIRATTTTNSIASGRTLTFGVRELTAVAGGADVVTATYAASHVTGSEVTLTTPAASSRFNSASGEFALTAGYWAMGLTVAGAGTTDAMVHVLLALDVRFP